MFIEYQLSNIGAYHINLYGMNTALISDWYDVDDDGKGHKLFLPKLAYNIDAPQKGQINILMMHHPLNRVKTERKYRRPWIRNSKYKYTDIYTDLRLMIKVLYIFFLERFSLRLKEKNQNISLYTTSLN